MNHLTDNELLRQTKSLVQKERELLTEVLDHLREISDRKLFSELGYKSLFEFAVKHLGYSADQAYRRIAAMKLVKQVPGLDEKIQNGEVHLSHIGIAQNLFQHEAKSANPFSAEQKQEVFDKISGTSTREAEKITAQMSTKPAALRPEKVKAVSDTSVSLQVTISTETLKQIETLKGWLAHKFPELSTGELFEKLCEIGIRELSPSNPVNRKSTQTNPPRTNPTHQKRDQAESPKSDSPDLNHSKQIQQMEEKKIANPLNDSLDSQHLKEMKKITSTPPDSPDQSIREITEELSRHLPTSLRRQVFAKANNQCEKCQSVHFLEIDHRTPLALGGSNDPKNLRVLCRNCYQRAAINAFGKDKIHSHSKNNSSINKTHLTQPFLNVAKTVAGIAD